MGSSSMELGDLEGLVFSAPVPSLGSDLAMSAQPPPIIGTQCSLTSATGSWNTSSTQQPCNQAAGIYIAKALLDRGADVNVVGPGNVTPLSLASMSSYKELAMELLRWGADVTIADENGCVPLHHAIWHADIDVVRELVMHPRQDIDRRNIAGWTPLQRACFFGSTKMLPIIELLLKRGAKAFSIHTMDGCCAFNIARKYGYHKALDLMQKLS